MKFPRKRRRHAPQCRVLLAVPLNRSRCFARRHGNHPDPFRTPFYFVFSSSGNTPFRNEGGPASVTHRYANLPFFVQAGTSGVGRLYLVPASTRTARFGPCAPLMRRGRTNASHGLGYILVVAHVVNLGLAGTQHERLLGLLTAGSQLAEHHALQTRIRFIPYQANAVPPV